MSDTEQPAQPAPRRVTLRVIREVLKRQDRPLSNEELAREVGCAVRTIENYLYRWVQQAAGVRSVRKGPKEFVGWAYMPPEECEPYEPATETVERLEARIARLEGELARGETGRRGLTCA